MNVLAVGAHPDDVEAGCGGYLARRVVAGDRVWIFVATQGERGGGAFTRFCEAKRAVEILGVPNLVWGEMPDTAVDAGADTIHRIETLVREAAIEQVLVNTPGDSHQDHRAMAQATLAAVRRVPRVLCYYAPTSTRVMTRVVYADIGGTIDLKCEALTAHASQARHRLPELARAEALFWGARAGVHYAEAFEPVRWLL